MLLKTFVALWVFFVILGIVALAKRKYQKPWGCFYLALVAQLILCMPAGLMASVDRSDFFSKSIGDMFQVWPYMVGGYSVCQLYLSSVCHLDWLLGGRENVVQGLEYYLFLMVIQTAIISFVVGARWYRTKRLYDWLALLALALFLVNSIAGIEEMNLLFV